MLIVALAACASGGGTTTTKVGYVMHANVGVSRGGTITVRLKPKHNHRYRVAMELKRGLAGTPLENEYWLMESQGHKYDVSPYLVAGISGTESSFGVAVCGGNAWGIASCGVTFKTFSDGVRFTTRLLHEDYGIGMPGNTAPGNPSLVKVGDRYAACGSCWADATSGHMQRFGADGTWLRYPG